MSLINSHLFTKSSSPPHLSVASAPQSQSHSLSNNRNYSDDNTLVLCEELHESNDSNITGINVHSSMAVSIPKLYHFSEPDHLLVIEDLGKLRNLEEWFTQPHINLDKVRDVGMRIGSFIARLHNIDVNQAIPPHDRDTFKSRIGHDLVEK